jgi:general secretion pathway protein A
MYTDFYGLKTFPFSITSNPQFFFESSSHKEALACLLYGIQEKRGLILITGEVGTGKTTLCKTLLTRLPPGVKTSVILNPYFSEVQLLRAVIEDFGLKSEKKTRLDIINALNSFLVEISLKGGTAVLIIDEAQNLSPRQLEQVRLLSNLETAQDKLLQILLVGQSEIEEKLHQFGLRQIRQRISIKYKISPLEESELKNYIDFRLKLAGEGNFEITPTAYKIIYEFSQGIPRLINLVCDRAMLYGFARNKKVFDEEIFKACVEELK